MKVRVGKTLDGLSDIPLGTVVQTSDQYKYEVLEGGLKALRDGCILYGSFRGVRFTIISLSDPYYHLKGIAKWLKGKELEEKEAPV